MKLPEEQVARLYATGFASGAISATMAGPLMNRFGPEMGCQAYFSFAVLSLIMTGRGNLPVLFLGRAFAGIATTLLFTSFESWMVTHYHALGLDDSTLPLGTIFGNMTLVSNAVAIGVGAVSEALIGITGIQRVPFTLAAAMCAFGSQSMLFLWGQYRATIPARSTSAAGRRRGFWQVVGNRKIMALGVASCCFEGAIYLFVFLWTPVLQSARQRAGTQGELPLLGFIFASFTCAMLIGTMAVAKANVNFTRDEAVQAMLTAMLFAAWFLSLVVRFNIESVQFGAFCIFEAAIGAVFPLIALLKSQHIDDADRNLVYSMFRLPLNVPVLLVHSLDREGKQRRHQQDVVRD